MLEFDSAQEAEYGNSLGTESGTWEVGFDSPRRDRWILYCVVCLSTILRPVSLFFSSPFALQEMLVIPQLYGFQQPIWVLKAPWFSGDLRAAAPRE